MGAGRQRVRRMGSLARSHLGERPRKAAVNGEWQTRGRMPDGCAGVPAVPPGPAGVVGHVVHAHYNDRMKTAVIPQIRVEPELRADLDSVLLPGETLTQFVEASVRRAVEFRRVQTDFAARCDASLAAYERTGVSIPSDDVLAKLEAKIAARVNQLRQ